MKQNKHNQRGQSIVETVVAIAMMVTGVSAAVGLANFSYASSINLSRRLVATGLAREGLEAVKNMRDTNWLAQRSTNISKTCYDYIAGTNTGSCYTGWLNQQFCLDPTDVTGACVGNASPNFILGFNGSSGNFWNFQRQGGTSNFGLSYDATNGAGLGIYTIGAGAGVACGTASSEYCRKIIITKNTTAPFNQNEGPRLIVQSQVWWRDKNCPLTADWPGPGKCAVELDTYLTNWKNY